MLGKLLRGTGMKRISISFLLQDGRWAIFFLACERGGPLIALQTLIPWYTIPFFPLCCRYMIRQRNGSGIPSTGIDSMTEAQLVWFMAWILSFYYLCFLIHAEFVWHRVGLKVETFWEAKWCIFYMSICILVRYEWMRIVLFKHLSP